MSNNSYEMPDFIREYNFANSSITLVGAESLFIAFIVGVAKYDIGWGIGSFIVIMLLYGFPLVAGVFSLALSFIEAYVVYWAFTNFTSVIWSWILGIFAFFLLVKMHRYFGKVDIINLGYSLLLLDCLVVPGSLYIVYQKKFLSITLLIVLLILMFVPILRIIESASI